MSRQARLARARAELAALRPLSTSSAGLMPLGDPVLDEALGGGLALGAWHETAGEGPDLETAALAAAFVAVLAAPLARHGRIVWVVRRDDLYGPGLASLGFPAEDLIHVAARSEAEALFAVEQALLAPGVAAAVGESEGAGLVAGRRLQLACEKRGATGFLIRRRPFGGASSEAAGTPASRWRIAPAPSLPLEAGLGPVRWRLELERSRGGRPGSWVVEKTDDAHPLRVVAELGDHDLATAPSFRLAG